MANITNEFMQQMLAKSKEYTILILRKGPNDNLPERNQIVWEHGRRNFELREAGLLSIVCPVANNDNYKGIGIFNTDKEKVKEIMEEDPCVKAGIFIYEILSARSFPGDALS
jgi:YCII-related domain-containing protein